jgi:predicted esterase
VRDAGPDAPREGAPRPLLVALHGDGGGVRAVVRAWKDAAVAAGAILLAPACPRALGCPAGSFWQWLAGSDHDPGWLGAQIDATAARFAVDERHVVAAGYSGGATYLGWYAPTHPGRFAAVAHVAGGNAYRPPCPACKYPVLFVLGATDPMIDPYTRPLRDWYEACGGHEIVWETLRGVTHESILDVLQAGRARSILAWLLSHPASCGGAPLDAGTGAAPDAAAASVTTGAPRAEDPPPAPAPPAPSASGPPPVPPAATGCTCGVAAAAASPLAAGGALAMAVAGRRRRRARRARSER